MVKIRDLITEDEKIIFEWISYPDLRKMTGTRGTPNKEGHSSWFQKKIMDSCNRMKIILYNDIPVGLIGTNDIDQLNRNAEIYLYIGDSRWKRCGIGKKAIEIFIQLLRFETNIHKVNARIFSYNFPSIRLFEKCGFIKEGIMREQICIDDEEQRYCDLIWYGLILEDE